MNLEKTPLNNLLLLKPKVHGDHRGHFIESYNKESLLSLGIDIQFVQDNQSLSKKGTFRGLHFQKNPKAQTKLIRCVSGEILDIAVDLRPQSSTYKKCFSVVLSSENFLQMLVPKGFAHGFLVLSETALISYKCDEYYHPELESGLSYKDPLVTVSWPMNTDDFIFSQRDLEWPLFI